MSVQKVKDLFLSATNSKVIIGGDHDQYLEDQLRKAHELGQDLQDKIWRYIPAYRLAHLLFRAAKNKEQFYEIVELLQYAEMSKSNYISLNSGILKFAALNRLKLLGVEDLKCGQRECVNSIIEKISAVNEEERYLDAWDKPVQSDYFNILEYLVYATAYDYQPLVGAGHDERNTLFPRFNNDVWRIVGTTGPVDEFSYNYETGFMELDRLCHKNEFSAYFVLGDPQETRILNAKGKRKTSFSEIKLLYEVMKGEENGIEARELAKIWKNVNNAPEAAKKGRKSIEDFLGGNVFTFNPAINRWSIKQDLPIYGLVKRRHQS